ncbi:hypothetical protein [Gordonia shandongensis]|uniref:hypothetical protein n=1 Tax=Gordonia shandongensis TaxID=376351 RepID=UPI0012EBD32A|nr:hypothetical protein [Gordonia shandongensis]
MSIAWGCIALLGIATSIIVSIIPVGAFDLSCSKTRELADPSARRSASCDDTVFQALGIGPAVQVAVILSVPAAVAAVALRTWVSATVTIIYTAPLVVGVLDWPTWRIALLPSGALMITCSLVLTLFQRSALRHLRRAAVGS